MHPETAVSLWPRACCFPYTVCCHSLYWRRSYYQTYIHLATIICPRGQLSEWIHFSTKRSYPILQLHVRRVTDSQGVCLGVSEALGMLISARLASDLTSADKVTAIVLACMITKLMKYIAWHARTSDLAYPFEHRGHRQMPGCTCLYRRNWK